MTHVLRYINEISVARRCVIVSLCFQVALWAIFGLSYFRNIEAWSNVPELAPGTAAVGGWWTTLLFIVANNLFICLLIIGGNLFVKFNVYTPGLFVLLIQAVMIGWMAGSNGFEVPFISVAAANAQFLRIGLWETTAYALCFAVTFPKSLLIAESFPAKSWSEVRKLRDMRLNTSEAALLSLAALALLTAAVVETFALVQ